MYLDKKNVRGFVGALVIDSKMYLFVLSNIITATTLHGLIITAATLHGFVTGFVQDEKIKVKNVVCKNFNNYFRCEAYSECLPRMPTTSCSYIIVMENSKLDNINFLSREELELKIENSKDNDRNLIRYDRNEESKKSESRET